MKNLGLILLGLGTSATLATFVVWADPVGQGVKLAPGVRLFPALASEIVYEDNLYFTADNEQDAMGLRFRPTIDLGIVSDTSEYQVFYRGEATFYDTVSEDDYFDNAFSATAKFTPYARHRFGIRTDLIYEHTPFGLDRTEGTARADRELDQYRDRRADVSYTFGAPTAKLNLEFRAGLFDRRFDTNRAQTRFLDYDAPNINFTALYRNSPRSTLLFELGKKDIEYDAPTANPRSGEERRIAAGVRWLATAKTEGVVKVGKFERDFESGLRQDFDNTDWLVALSWSPRTYSTVKFQTSRTSVESYFDAADFINIDSIGLDWRHEWSPFWVSTVGISQQDNVYVNEPQGREDDVKNLKAGLEYKLTRSVSLTGDYTYTDRDSNVTLGGLDIGYTRNTFILGIKAAY